MRELKENNDAIVIPFKTIAFIFVLIAVVVLYIIYDNAQLKPCNECDETLIKGQLGGFERNNSYWDVRVDNVSYLFKFFDEEYMRSMIGSDVIISACFRDNSYDLLSCYINWGK